MHWDFEDRRRSVPHIRGPRPLPDGGEALGPAPAAGRHGRVEGLAGGSVRHLVPLRVLEASLDPLTPGGRELPGPGSGGVHLNAEAFGRSLHLHVDAVHEQQRGPDRGRGLLPGERSLGERVLLGGPSEGLGWFRTGSGGTVLSSLSDTHIRTLPEDAATARTTSLTFQLGLCQVCVAALEGRPC